MLACCGLDCSTCEILQAANDHVRAEALAQAWRDGGWQDAKAEWFRCQGCSGPDDVCWSEDCAIRACCRERKLAHCALCADFPCGHIAKFEADGEDHAAAIATLRDLRR